MFAPANTNIWLKQGDEINPTSIYFPDSLDS